MTLDQIVAFLIDDSGLDLEDLEARLVREAMRAAKQNVSQAAGLLGLTRSPSAIGWKKCAWRSRERYQSILRFRSA
jgi:hypothetical protein